MGWFFTSFPIWAKLAQILRKFWKNQWFFLKIWPNIGPIGIWMGHFLEKNGICMGLLLKFHIGTSLPKPNLSTPPNVCTHKMREPYLIGISKQLLTVAHNEVFVMNIWIFYCFDTNQTYFFWDETSSLIDPRIFDLGIFDLIKKQGFDGVSFNLFIKLHTD